MSEYQRNIRAEYFSSGIMFDFFRQMKKGQTTCVMSQLNSRDFSKSVLDFFVNSKEGDKVLIWMPISRISNEMLHPENLLPFLCISIIE